MISSTVVADNSVMALYFMLLIVIPSLPIIKGGLRQIIKLSQHQKPTILLATEANSIIRYCTFDSDCSGISSNQF